MPLFNFRLMLCFSLLFTLPISADISLATNKESQANMRHAITLYGEPKYPADFTHFDYTNPNAPKGGALKQAVIGLFNNLNPYIDKGTAAAGSNLMYDTLLARSWDEPLTKYGYIAEKIELDPANNWAAFYINPKARFHDNKPVTAQDVKFSFYLLREKGSVFYKNFYKEVKSVEVTEPNKVIFYFTHNKNRELPLILGQIPIFPEHYWKERDFSSSAMDVPIGSGPYRVVNIVPGRSITYERVKDYWGKGLPVNKGRFNFDRLTYEYYRDNTVALQALLAGEYDFKLVDDPRVWHKKIKDTTLKKYGLTRQLINNKNPQTLTLTYNTRRAFLHDEKVRKSLGYAFDFDWINKHYFHSMYHRGNSYFSGTPFAATGMPTSDELKLLTPWKASLPKALFEEPYVVPGSKDKHVMSDRKKKSQALALLEEAGWKLSPSGLYKDGKKLKLEALVMLDEHKDNLLIFKKNLAGIGVQLKIRKVDAAQYIERIRNHDFDMILHTFPHTPSPGTEQANLWGSTTVNQHGSRNLSGANLPVIDALTANIAQVTSFAQLQSNVRAMDRVLLWQQYSLPLWYLPVWPIIHKQNIRSPASPAAYALDLMSWWYQP
ncbi:MAG: extracellular solute-binding protein [Endozoicomonas sp. (ex Botrylloides leachii)]|nr:extracellular solute-binding protein [Endozoicomonas sp. (ex Botrylloides leachii)]